MLTLYDYLPSQNAWKIRVLLGLLGIGYETRIVSIFEGEGRTEAFLKLNRAGAVPVLADVSPDMNAEEWEIARSTPGCILEVK